MQFRWDTKTILLAMAFALLPIAAIYLLDRGSAPSSEPLVTPPEALAPASMLPSPAAQLENHEPKPTEIDKSLQAPLSAPNHQTLRKEVEANPHRPPTTLLEFAKGLAPKMRIALDSEPAATQFFATLEVCVKQENSSTSTRALCLSNAESLKNKYPSLTGRYDELYRATPAKIQKLVR